MVCVSVVCVVPSYAADNDALLEVGYFLEMQVNAPNGTFISRNPKLCMQPILAWSRRSDSIVEYALSSVCQILHRH